jgi:predicted Zn-dependent protease
LELKAIIAHEIGHLVGIPHISDKGALMNPILQENQKRRLELTNADIKNFNKYF